MPAKISISGFKKCFCLKEAISFMYKAVPMPSGTHTNIAPAVTHKEAAIKDKMPNSAGS
jgi:hypothetical protein